MKVFNYKDVGKAIGWNFENVNYSVVSQSGFDYYKEVVSHITSKTKILDIGCGSAEKAVRFYALAKKIYLTDLEPEMLARAKRNVEKIYENDLNLKKKFSFKILDCEDFFDFPDCYFDMVVSRHCGANMKEVFRVLKPGGIFVSEDYSSYDCFEIKEIFGRGQNYKEEPFYNRVMTECVDAGFSKIEFLRFEEIEHYKGEDDLKYLLSHTPILNGFDDAADDEKLKEYVKKFSSKKGIRLNRKLHAFVLKK